VWSVVVVEVLEAVENWVERLDGGWQVATRSRRRRPADRRNGQNAPIPVGRGQVYGYNPNLVASVIPVHSFG